MTYTDTVCAVSERVGTGERHRAASSSSLDASRRRISAELERAEVHDGDAVSVSVENAPLPRGVESHTLWDSRVVPDVNAARPGPQAEQARSGVDEERIDNETFFRDYRRMCEIETVDFATSWQWPQGHHPMPCFGERLGDPDPRVRAEISRIAAACER